VVHSEDAVGLVQRHWLAERITDDCPRCGWHGYFHHYLATVDGDWAAAVCDHYADLHPGITVTVKFFSARFGRGEPFVVIRQRDRSDHDYPDIGHFPDTGQQLTWRLWWEHTSKLVEEALGGADADLAETSRAEAEADHRRAGGRLLAARRGRAAVGGLRLSAMTPHTTRRSRAGNTGREREVREWARSTGSGIRTGRLPR
jgi:hypothetical protein